MIDMPQVIVMLAEFHDMQLINGCMAVAVFYNNHVRNKC